MKSGAKAVFFREMLIHSSISSIPKVVIAGRQTIETDHLDLLFTFLETIEIRQPIEELMVFKGDPSIL